VKYEWSEISRAFRAQIQEWKVVFDDPEQAEAFDVSMRSFLLCLQLQLKEDAKRIEEEDK
jgi:hypothetical protein